MKLSGKTAVVTGGSYGIGYAVASLFVREGARVAIAGRDETKGKAALEALGGELENALYVRADVSRAEDVKNLVEETVGRFGRLDILVNNAGTNPVGTALDTTEEVWDRVMAVNLKGPFLCCKHAIPHMIRAGGGSIINIGSINSFMASENEAAYDASKGGVLLFTKATALDFARHNIRVNCICPGAVDTPLLRAIFAKPEPGGNEERHDTAPPPQEDGISRGDSEGCSLSRVRRLFVRDGILDRRRRGDPGGLARLSPGAF
jgi:NAD(P)-dependent dehydrogenase (short-subunit alcohol dehydrogenase family)